MSEVKNNDVFVISNKKDLENVLQRLKDVHEGHVFTKPKILSKRESESQKRSGNGHNGGQKI